MHLVGNAGTVPYRSERINPRLGWVYLISAGDERCKVGYTRDPEKRLAQLQPGNPEVLRIIGVIDAPRSLEREVHRDFRHRRVRGEWYVKTEDLVGYFEDYGFVCICEPLAIDAECFIHGEFPDWVERWAHRERAA